MYDHYKYSEVTGKEEVNEIEFKDLVELSSVYGFIAHKNFIHNYRLAGIIGKPRTQSLGRGMGRTSYYRLDDAAALVASVSIVRGLQKSLAETKEIKDAALSYLRGQGYNCNIDQDAMFLFIDRYLRVMAHIPPSAYTQLNRDEGKGVRATFGAFAFNPISRTAESDAKYFSIIIDKDGKVIRTEECNSLIELVI